MHKLCEENQKSEKLINDMLSYKFLFNMVLTAPNCPHKWKNNVLKPQPYSIYSKKDQMVTGPLQQFICDLLDLPAFAGGRFDSAYDELFGGDPAKTKVIEINLDGLKKAVARSLVGKTFGEDLLTNFIDIVSYHPRIYSFSKTKFVAAMRYYAVKFRPQITRHFKEPMPGMANYTAAGGAVAA